MKRLTKRQILLLHEQLLQEFGGTPGVRDEGLLDSALAAPFQTFDGQSLYPSVQAKAAQLGFGLVCNHPFVDGNKRIGTHVMLVFLALNGIELSYTQQELIDIIFAVAASQASAAELCSGSSNTRNENWSLLWQAPGFYYSLTIGSFNRKGQPFTAAPVVYSVSSSGSSGRNELPSKMRIVSRRPYSTRTTCTVVCVPI